MTEEKGGTEEWVTWISPLEGTKSNTPELSWGVENTLDFIRANYDDLFRRLGNE